MYEWTQEMRDRCQNECAFYGDPPCWRLHELVSDFQEPLEPCEECRAARASDKGDG